MLGLQVRSLSIPGWLPAEAVMMNLPNLGGGRGSACSANRPQRFSLRNAAGVRRPSMSVAVRKGWHMPSFHMPRDSQCQKLFHKS